MRTDLVDQPSAMPTRKMLAVAIAGVIAAALTQWFDQLADLTVWLAWLASDGVKAAVPVLAAFAAGYIVRERAPAEAAEPGDWPESQARLQTAPLATLAAIGLALLMLSGCATNAEVLWGQSQQGYNDVMGTIKEYRAPCVASAAWPNGGPEHPLCRIDDDLYRKIEPVRAEVDTALKAWRDALNSGNTVTADFYLGQVEDGLSRLRRYLAEAEMED